MSADDGKVNTKYMVKHKLYPIEDRQLNLTFVKPDKSQRKLARVVSTAFLLKPSVTELFCKFVNHGTLLVLQ